MKFNPKVFAAFVIVLTYPLGAHGNGLENLESDYADGIITLQQALELKALMLTGPQSLPEKYALDEPLRDGTLLALEILQNQAILDQGFKERFPTILTRVNKQAYYDSPLGLFRIHFDTTGGHAVYQPEVDINPPDGTPDYVNRTAEYFDLAWIYICDTLGYDTPPYDSDRGGGMDLYDVYMHHYSGAYGVTFSEFSSNQRPGRNYDYCSYIYVDPTYNGFGYNDRTLPMKVTSAHEFFHAVQFAYNVNAGGWYMENCATWMEDILWDDINDNYAYLSLFMNNVHRPLTTANGGFEYGAFVWPMFLYENWGHDFIRTSWEFCINSNAVAALELTCDQYGTILEEQYIIFSLWNYLTGFRDDGNHYEEGSAYTTARTMRAHTAYPVENQTTFLPPTALACNYILFSNTGQEGDLEIVFDGDDSDLWYNQIIKATSNSSHVYDVMELDIANYGLYVVEDFGQFDWVAMATDLIIGSGANYLYSARLFPTGIDDPSNRIPSEFVLRGNYPNPFNGSTSIQLHSTAEQTVNLTVYDILGGKILDRDYFVVAGENRLKFEMENTGHSKNASGIYFFRLASGQSEQHGNMLYLK